MVSREYFLKQAETCLRLAKSLTEGEVAQRLRAITAEFREKARTAEYKLRSAQAA
jgi:hypothetical protein